MEDEHTERGKDARYPIEANVIVQKNGGETIPATAVNVSSTGMLLHIEPPSELSIDEQVTVEIELPDHPDQPFSTWGTGKVVQMDGCRFGIQLHAGLFYVENPSSFPSNRPNKKGHAAGEIPA